MWAARSALGGTGRGISLLRAWAFGHACEVKAHALRAPDGGLLSSTRVREAIEAGKRMKPRGS